MRDISADIQQLLAKGERVALATVVRTWGSAPRQAGAKMAVSSGGQISGSVSGGCVEGAVVEAAGEVLEDGRARLLHFGVADETAWTVGLACGGEIEVFVEALEPQAFAWLTAQIAADREGRVATIVRGPEHLVGRQAAEFAPEARLSTLDKAAAVQLLASAWEQHTSAVLALEDGVDMFVEVYQPAPQLVVVGGVHIAQALTEMAQVLGFRCAVIDPRRAFGSEARFEHVDQLVQAWPEAALAQLSLTGSTAVVLLTHDPKIDDAALKIVLGSPAYYIGALGSRQTHARRVERLIGYGFSQEQIQRIHAPVGLDIGAREPAEIALAILAEIIAARHGALQPRRSVV